MSRMVQYASAAGAIVERDFRVFVSYRARVLSQLFGLCLSMLIFYYVSKLVDVDAFSSPEQYFAFVATGLLVTNVLQSVLAVPMTIRHELVAGTFERLMISPFGVLPALMAMLVFPMLLACAIAIVGFVGVALAFDLPVAWSTAPLAIPVALLGAISFSALGLLMAASVIVFKQAPGAAAVIALITLASGVYFPVELLPGWIAWVAEVQPFTPAVELLRELLLGSTGAESPAAALAKLVGFIVVLVPLSALVVSAALRFARRRGTILEY
jgi:ABC-2 type transport system permease protein